MRGSWPRALASDEISPVHPGVVIARKYRLIRRLAEGGTVPVSLIVDGDTLREAVEAAQLIDGRRWYEHLAVFLKRLTVDLTPDVLL